MPDLACKACASTDVRPSRQKESGDAERAGLGEPPYRCRACGVRFYAPGKPDPRKRPLPQRLRDFWKHKRGPFLQGVFFFLMLALFLLCLRYLAHYQPDNSPPN